MHGLLLFFWIGHCSVFVWLKHFLKISCFTPLRCSEIELNSLISQAIIVTSRVQRRERCCVLKADENEESCQRTGVKTMYRSSLLLFWSIKNSEVSIISCWTCWNHFLIFVNQWSKPDIFSYTLKQIYKVDGSTPSSNNDKTSSSPMDRKNNVIGKELYKFCFSQIFTKLNFLLKYKNRTRQFSLQNF